MELIASQPLPLWIAFVKRWAICFVVAVGIAWLSVSSVHIAVLLARALAWTFGTQWVDQTLPPSC